MPVNECIPFRVPGESIPIQATGAMGGMRFCKISGPRVGGGQTGGTSRVTTTGPGYGANTLSTDVVDLPQAGIKGNSHMLMMDKNNAEVAALIQKWLEGKGLTK